jgi:hypothetical protein
MLSKTIFVDNCCMLLKKYYIMLNLSYIKLVFPLFIFYRVYSKIKNIYLKINHLQ